MTIETMTDEEMKLATQFAVNLALAERLPPDCRYEREGKSREDGILIRLGLATVSVWPKMLAELAARHQQIRRLQTPLVATWDAAARIHDAALEAGLAGDLDDARDSHPRGDRTGPRCPKGVRRGGCE